MSTPHDTAERADVYQRVTDQKHETQDDGEETTSHRGCIARGYSVFNADQVDGYAAPGRCGTSRSGTDRGR